MKISSVNISISNEDLLSVLKDLIEEFLPEKGIEINQVTLDESINIKGQYKGRVKVSFEASLEVCSVVNNMIKLRIADIKVGKFKIFKFIRNFALKKALDGLKDYGVFVDKEFIVVAMDKLEEYIPVVNFNILSIRVDNTIKVEIDNVDINLKEIMNKEKEQNNEDKDIKHEETEDKETEDKENKDKVEEDSGQEEEPVVIVKKEDAYTDFRSGLASKVPDKYEGIAKYAMVLPDMAALFIRLFKDKRVEGKTKVQLAVIMGYLTFPIDIIPDFIPFIGKIDDVAIAFLGLNKLLNEIPENIILENWQGEDDIIKIAKEGVFYISNVIGTDKISNVLSALKNGAKGKNIKKNDKKLKDKKHKKTKDMEKDGCKDGMDK